MKKPPNGRPTPHAPTLHDEHRHDERPTFHAPRSTPTLHAHAHAHAHERPAEGPFLHERLDAYRIALEMNALANRLNDQIPRGYRNVADHMLRAASNTVLLLAEGANRWGAGEKRQRFVESRGECAEVGAAADLLLVYAVTAREDAERLKILASRVSAMLTRLIGRLDSGGRRR